MSIPDAAAPAVARGLLLAIAHVERPHVRKVERATRLLAAIPSRGEEGDHIAGTQRAFAIAFRHGQGLERQQVAPGHIRPRRREQIRRHRRRPVHRIVQREVLHPEVVPCPKTQGQFLDGRDGSIAARKRELDLRRIVDREVDPELVRDAHQGAFVQDSEMPATVADNFEACVAGAAVHLHRPGFAVDDQVRSDERQVRNGLHRDIRPVDAAHIPRLLASGGSPGPDGPGHIQRQALDHRQVGHLYRVTGRVQAAGGDVVLDPFVHRDEHELGAARRRPPTSLPVPSPHRSRRPHAVAWRRVRNPTATHARPRGHRAARRHSRARRRPAAAGLRTGRPSTTAGLPVATASGRPRATRPGQRGRRTRRPQAVPGGPPGQPSRQDDRRRWPPSPFRAAQRPPERWPRRRASAHVARRPPKAGTLRSIRATGASRRPRRRHAATTIERRPAPRSTRAATSHSGAGTQYTTAPAKPAVHGRRRQQRTSRQAPTCDATQQAPAARHVRVDSRRVCHSSWRFRFKSASPRTL